MTRAIAPRWIWSRIEQLLRELEWNRKDLDECATDCYGRPFLELTFDEGREVLHSMTHLVGFKRWKEKRNG